jgi:hypothetical protein
VLRSRSVSKLRSLIDQAGGLHTRTGLAKRWGVSKTYVSEVVRREDFPRPITQVDGREVWTGEDADAWRRAPRKAGPAPQ